MKNKVWIIAIAIIIALIVIYAISTRPKLELLDLDDCIDEECESHLDDECNSINENTNNDLYSQINEFTERQNAYITK